MFFVIYDSKLNIIWFLTAGQIKQNTTLLLFDNENNR